MSRAFTSSMVGLRGSRGRRRVTVLRGGRRPRRRSRLRASPRSGGRDVELEGLAAVAQVERAQRASAASGAKPSRSSWLRARSASISAKAPGERRRRARASGPTRVRTSSCLMSEASRPSAEKLPGMPRDEDARDADLVGHREGVHGPGAAEGDQGEVARIVAALDRDLADRGGHAGDRDRDDALGERLDAERPVHPARPAPPPPRAPRRDRARCCRPGAGRVPMRPEHHVGVGDRGLGAAEAVGGRARRRRPRCAGRPGGCRPRRARRWSRRPRPPCACRSASTLTGNAPTMASDGHQRLADRARGRRRWRCRPCRR